MKGFLCQFGTSLRLYSRNRMGLIYSYLFPILFLIAFAVLYREREPLLQHMGELLTVAILGGACFGVATTLVNERERGVWRRFRLAPISSRSLVGGTLASRYVSLMGAGLIQMILAVALAAAILHNRGEPAATWSSLLPIPAHPIGLFVTFTFVCFALLGLGLTIAMLADTVQAVQALGQCIFLPMLVIGGVAVRLDLLPTWAQHLSAFFPGRYAVAAIQSCYDGRGLAESGFNLLALTLIGASASATGAMMFRWDARQRFMNTRGKGWIGASLAAWLVVGMLAERQGIALLPSRAEAASVSVAQPIPPPAPQQKTGAPAAGRPGTRLGGMLGGGSTSTPAQQPEGVPADSSRVTSSQSAASAPVGAPSAQPARWQDVKVEDWWNWDYDRLPPDDGVVSPFAESSAGASPDVVEWVEFIRVRLPLWEPGKVEDPVQRVRNYLYVLAIPDVAQLPIENNLPVVVFDYLKQSTVPETDLPKLLAWIVMHPDDGDMSAVSELYRLGIETAQPANQEVRRRTINYAMKFLYRLP